MNYLKEEYQATDHEISQVLADATKLRKAFKKDVAKGYAHSRRGELLITAGLNAQRLTAALDWLIKRGEVRVEPVERRLGRGGHRLKEVYIWSPVAPSTPQAKPTVAPPVLPVGPRTALKNLLGGARILFERAKERISDLEVEELLVDFRGGDTAPKVYVLDADGAEEEIHEDHFIFAPDDEFELYKTLKAKFEPAAAALTVEARP